MPTSLAVGEGFRLQPPFAVHDAVCCCRAKETSSGEDFILKTIRFPASAVQLDALLMTGAFPDRSAANAYYREQANATVSEAKTLRHLAALGGFTDFDFVQAVRVEGVGYEVQLLASEKPSLQSILSDADVTQMEVLNMALDISAALSACRHAGFFYADLKPSNVFRIGQRYCIGDLGFVPLSSIGKAVLPERCRSEYTAPELQNGKLPLNDTADVYALGMMLYQAYNDGELPGPDDIVGQLLAPPKYADYELARIILRACAPDSAVRWNDPQQMNAALCAYLQRNGVHDVPIVAPKFREVGEAVAPPIEDFLPEIYDEEELRIPLWEIESPAVPVSAVPKRAVTAKKPAATRRTRIGMAAVCVFFVLALIVGACLLPRSEASALRIERLYAETKGEKVVLTLQCENASQLGWIVTVSAQGQETKSYYFVGNSLQIPSLTLGENYTFTLSAQNGQALSGQTTIRYTPTAQDDREAKK